MDFRQVQANSLADPNISAVRRIFCLSQYPANTRATVKEQGLQGTRQVFIQGLFRAGIVNPIEKCKTL